MTQQLNAVRSFRNIPIFRGLTDDEMFEIVRICRLHQHKSGTVLFRQGDPGDAAFIIESGVIDIRVESGTQKETIAQLGSNEVLGELALIDPGLRSATAVVSSDAVLYELRAADFQQLRDGMHAGAYKVIRALSRIVCTRLRSVNERIEAHMRGDDPMPPVVSAAQRRSTASQTAAQNTAPRGAQPSGINPVVTGNSRSVSDVVEDAGAFARGLFSKLWKGGGG
jgi:CRP/FNR family cyclic AMP-dependent transcriptional regulator